MTSRVWSRSSGHIGVWAIVVELVLVLDVLAVAKVVVIVQLHQLWSRGVGKRWCRLEVRWGMEEGCWWVRGGHVAGGKAGEVDAIVDTWAAGVVLGGVAEDVVVVDCHAIVRLLRVCHAARGWGKERGCAESRSFLGEIVLSKAALSRPLHRLTVNNHGCLLHVLVVGRNECSVGICCGHGSLVELRGCGR